VLKGDGSVNIRGTNITVESSGRTTVKASGDLTLKGARVLSN
jgi:type VI secretion system secreted protein VgrG